MRETIPSLKDGAHKGQLGRIGVIGGCQLCHAQSHHARGQTYETFLQHATERVKSVKDAH